MKRLMRPILIILTCLIVTSSFSQNVRQDISLNKNWLSIAADEANEFEGFENSEFITEGWQPVTVPHNWDRYEGYRRLQHGNRHGCSWYRKTFEVPVSEEGKRYFLFFEGVGSYATVYLNGIKVGEHAGGRTTFTLDVTAAIKLEGENLLAVKADHPAQIQDLPWVCGGCSDEYGFSEGSQPMGIFRPVHLIVTNPVRIEPFGVHAWNDTTVSESGAKVNVRTEIRNYGEEPAKLKVTNKLIDKNGSVVSEVKSKQTLAAGAMKMCAQKLPEFKNVNLWSVESPYLYTLVTEVYDGRNLVDRLETAYGIRWMKWDIGEGGSNQFFLNGKPVVINGTAEYEHNMGKSHAFSDEMVKARVMQMKSAGFNAFRDAHQPHNFRYHHSWDSLGFLWWTQMAAHIWYDTPEFRENFKTLLRDWVKERRNSPSIMLWGLENESTLPTEFAEECTAIIREMDPTSLTQRLVTTCNGGTGTDWNVPQNWTGTYGGNPDEYNEDLERQVLVGEYGAWRTLDLHTEGPFDQDGIYSEDRMTLLMEKKVRLGEQASDSSSGHFQWIFTSHENPGRNQSGEAFRELDRVGPVNYKGLLSPWGEPADVFYMFRSNYAPKETEPMVYIVSHTWPNRWNGPGMKDSLVVYSNCDEVELFNGLRSLGRKKHPGHGMHFQWDGVNITEELIIAKGFVNGREVANDELVFQNLPRSVVLLERAEQSPAASAPSKLNYVYRVNCGGSAYTDYEGGKWMADVALPANAMSFRREEESSSIQKDENTDEQDFSQTRNDRNPPFQRGTQGDSIFLNAGRFGSTSWTSDFADMPPYYASQRRTFNPIIGTRDDALYQTFRYGMDKLKYYFPLPDGNYEVELHFIEPWYGTGAGMNCEDWRNFDVSINGETVLDDLDIWSEAGHDRVLVKTIEVEARDGGIVISFPEVKSGQAIISAIAIATEDQSVKPAPPADPVFTTKYERVKSWLDWGDRAFAASTFQYLPPELFGATWLQTAGKGRDIPFELKMEADVYVALQEGADKPAWLSDFDLTKQYVRLAGQAPASYQLYKKRLPKGYKTTLEISGQNMIVMAQRAASMAPPYDLKPKVPYNEDVAILETDHLIKEEKKYGFGCVTFLSDDESKVSWPIQTGVADFHAIHFKFSNETGAELPVTFNLIAADGTLMQSEEVIFHETPKDKYREVSTSTSSMINAGSYRVQIVGEGVKGLSIRGIRVQ